MYKQFFGFKELPFKLVPDPDYFFLGKSQEEVLAHLSYAIEQGEGFVEITGEVGTGKTTLCRMFLDNLGKDAEVAYIFNPKLDAVQLLKAINDEFNISSEGNDIKQLTDSLNVFLLERKKEDKKAILLIDEAQNLTKSVLEQIRLLSNLETTQSKLLQIILVGQPELEEMLDAPELRQLAQRINLSCRLEPLSLDETRDYIDHRIRIASKVAGVRFSGRAARTIYKYTNGIPRLINIACDRALTVAFGKEQKNVSGTVASQAVKELSHRRSWGAKQRGKSGFRFFVMGLILLLTGMGYFLIRYSENSDVVSKIQNLFSKSQPELKKVDEISPEHVNKPGPVEEDSPSLPSAGVEDSVAGSGDDPEGSISDIFLMDPKVNRREAVLGALSQWGNMMSVDPVLDTIDSDSTYFQQVAKLHGLSVRGLGNDLNLIEKLNLPAVLELRNDASLSPRFMALTRIKEGRATLTGITNNLNLSIDELKRYWSGAAYVPWSDFYQLKEEISRSAPYESIVAVKILLREIGFDEIEINPVFDRFTKDAVRQIQVKYGLEADGVVGSLTKIALYNEIPSLNIPHLRTLPEKTIAIDTGPVGEEEN